MGGARRLCANCVEKAASKRVNVNGRECWVCSDCVGMPTRGARGGRYEHLRTQGAKYGGAGYLPNADEQLEWGSDDER